MDDRGETDWSACFAPHGSMYFDQRGKVRACCQNTDVPLGDVTRQSLREIWESADAERLRSALEHGDYAAGCDFCGWQLREGNAQILFARQFDDLRPPDTRPRWPRQMEFSLTNTCNLACTMCNGDWSSTIRARRERRDPLPRVYGDEFFDQLAEFLPHLRRVKFLGGEPFLGAEPLRVMELMAELPDPPHATITTNGTIMTPRVERILERLRPDIVVSIDAATTQTYDTIRVGAHFPDVIANLDRFIDRLGSDHVSIAHCLMTTNWREFAALLGLAEERGIEVGVNIVRFPSDLSLYHLDGPTLREIADELRRLGPGDLTAGRRRAWNGHVDAIANRARTLLDDPDAPLPGDIFRLLDPARQQLLLDELRRDSGEDPIEVEYEGERVRSVTEPPWSRWLAPSTWIGIRHPAISHTIVSTIGGVASFDQDRPDGSLAGRPPRTTVRLTTDAGTRVLHAYTFRDPSSGELRSVIAPGDPTAGGPP